jgi:hypothetical protein
MPISVENVRAAYMDQLRRDEIRHRMQRTLPVVIAQQQQMVVRSGSSLPNIAEALHESSADETTMITTIIDMKRTPPPPPPPPKPKPQLLLKITVLNCALPVSKPRHSLSWWCDRQLSLSHSRASLSLSLFLSLFFLESSKLATHQLAYRFEYFST